MLPLGQIIKHLLIYLPTETLTFEDKGKRNKINEGPTDWKVHEDSKNSRSKIIKLDISDDLQKGKMILFKYFRYLNNFTNLTIIKPLHSTSKYNIISTLVIGVI